MATEAEPHSGVQNLAQIVEAIVTANHKDDLYEREGMDVFLTKAQPTDSIDWQAVRKLHNLVSTCFAMRLVGPDPKFIRDKVRGLEEIITVLGEKNATANLIRDRYNKTLAPRIAEDAKGVAAEYGDVTSWQIQITSESTSSS